jgi:hypothetical protein
MSKPMHDFGTRKGHHVSMIVFAVIAIASCVSASAIAESLGPPQTSREVEFTYHTDVTGIDPKAHQVDVWIPLPRIDTFQRVTALSIDSPAPSEVVEQPSNGNRVAHLSATAPLPPSIPVTIRFKVRRIEESADLIKAKRNVAEPLGWNLQKHIGP